MKESREARAAVRTMTVDVLTSDLITEKVRNQIKKSLSINNGLTSTYALQVESVQDIKGKDSAHSGFYFILAGTRCGVKFFLNNDMKIVRKPNKGACEVKHEYAFFNDNAFSETFWCKNF